MSLKRTFAAPFAVALIGEVVAFFIHYDSVLSWSIYLGQYVLIALTCFLLGRADGSIGVAMKAVLPFAVLWLLAGLLNHLIGRSETPPGWTLDQDQQAFLGFLLAWSLFLILAFVVGFIGWLGAVSLRKTRRNAPV